MVAPLTTRVRGIPSEVSVGDEDGVARACVVNLDTITTIAKASLRERLTALSAEKWKAVEEALHFSLGLEWQRACPELNVVAEFISAWD
jgi:mRNA interferase MazF